MKKLEIVIRPEKLEALKKILEGCKANGIMISNIMGYGNQKGYTQMYRGTTYVVNLLPIEKEEKITAAIRASELEEGAERYLVMVTRKGTIKRTPISGNTFSTYSLVIM